MSSMIPNSLKRDVLQANINFGADTFKVMLLASGYTPDPDTQSKRSHLSSESSGTGYTAGGKAVAVTVETLDLANDKQVITFGAVTWSASSITARYAAVYKSRGGSAANDELIFVNDFGSDITSYNSVFTLPASTISLQ